MHLPSRPLNSDSTIGLVCPAGGFDDYKPIDRAIKYLKSLGYKVKLGKSVYPTCIDYSRKKDLVDLWIDKSVSAIFCLRGGYGSLRLLNDLDFSLFKSNKKIFLGFSDITVLLLAIYAKSKLMTFHGPMLGVNFLRNNLTVVDSHSANNMWKILSDASFSFSYTFKSHGIELFPGRVEGVLLGGNLTSICSMLGSCNNYLPDFKDSILFLEDYNEEPYKIDRLITQLVNAGIFSLVKGLILSSFYKCGFKNNKEIIKLVLPIIKRYKIPCIFNFPIGHMSKNYTVPIGQRVLLDTKKVSLSSL